MNVHTDFTNSRSSFFEPVVYLSPLLIGSDVRQMYLFICKETGHFPNAVIISQHMN